VGTAAGASRVLPLSDERLPIARIPFTDGSVRAVYEDADGRQFVIDNDRMVYGTWFLPDYADEPPVVVKSP
jgi:hypothetical protein